MSNQTELNYYFLNRFSDPKKYRGHHFFQHSRYNLKNVMFILNFIKQNGKVAEPRGDHKDYKKGGSKENILSHYITYVTLTIEYQSEFNLRGAQFNSVKKHLFPDMIHMNLIERFTDGNDRYVVLTKEGKEMIEESNETNLQMKWARAITKKIHSKCPTYIFSFIQLLEKIQYITEEELIFFGSYLDYEKSYDYNKIAKLIEYSRFLKTDYSTLKEKFRSESKKSLEDTNLNKSHKLDFGNFSNSTRSLWNALQEMIYFEKHNNGVRKQLVIRGSIKANGKEISFKRDSSISNLYINKHSLNLTDKDILDYHHVIPLFLAGTVEEKIQLDDWRNIIGIDQNTHAILTRRKKNNIIISTVDGNIILSDFKSIKEDILLTNKVNARYNIKVIETDTLSYNQEMLKVLNYT